MACSSAATVPACICRVYAASASSAQSNDACRKPVLCLPVRLIGAVMVPVLVRNQPFNLCLYCCMVQRQMRRCDPATFAGTNDRQQGFESNHIRVLLNMQHMIWWLKLLAEE
jgi:hypothetical protein